MKIMVFMSDSERKSCWWSESTSGMFCALPRTVVKGPRLLVAVIWAPHQLRWQNCREVGYVNCHLRKSFSALKRQKSRRTWNSKSVTKCKIKKSIQKSFRCWVSGSLLILQKGNVSCYQCIKSTAPFLHLLSELAKQNFCWCFIPNHEEKTFPTFLLRLKWKNDFLWKRQTFQIKIMASSVYAVSVQAWKRCEAAQSWSKHLIKKCNSLSVSIPQAWSNGRGSTSTLLNITAALVSINTMVIKKDNRLHSSLMLQRELPCNSREGEGTAGTCIKVQRLLIHDAIVSTQLLCRKDRTEQHSVICDGKNQEIQRWKTEAATSHQ